MCANNYHKMMIQFIYKLFLFKKMNKIYAEGGDLDASLLVKKQVFLLLILKRDIRQDLE